MSSENNKITWRHNSHRIAQSPSMTSQLLFITQAHVYKHYLLRGSRTNLWQKLNPKDASCIFHRKVFFPLLLWVLILFPLPWLTSVHFESSNVTFFSKLISFKELCGKIWIWLCVKIPFVLTWRQMRGMSDSSGDMDKLSKNICKALVDFSFNLYQNEKSDKTVPDATTELVFPPLRLTSKP